MRLRSGTIVPDVQFVTENIAEPIPVKNKQSVRCRCIGYAKSDILENIIYFAALVLVLYANCEIAHMFRFDYVPKSRLEFPLVVGVPVILMVMIAQILEFSVFAILPAFFITMWVHGTCAAAK